MRWIIFGTLFVLINGCGGPKKKSGSISNVAISSNGNNANIPADQTLLEIILFNPADINQEDASLAGRLNTYEFKLTKTDPECEGPDKEPVTGVLNSTSKRRVIQISNKCEYTAHLSYGYAPQENAPAENPPADNPPPAANLAPTYQNSMKDIIDSNCVSCHGAASAPRVDLSSYTAALKSFKDDTENLNSMNRILKSDGAGNTYIVMPPSETLRSVADSAKTHDSIIAELQAWKEAGFPEGEAAGLNLTLELGADSVFYEGIPLTITKELAKKKTLSLRFWLKRTAAGETEGFKTLLLQGDSYVRSNSTGPTAGTDTGNAGMETGSTGDTGDSGDTGTPAPAPEVLDTTLTFDQVGPLLIDADKGNCATAGCHSIPEGQNAPSVAPALATYTDYKTYIEADPLNKDTLANSIKNMTMPVPGRGTLDDAQRLMVRGWIEGGHVAGPATQAAIDANQPPALTFNANVFPLVMNSCQGAACHDNAIGGLQSFATAASAYISFENDAVRALILGRMDNAAAPMPPAGLIANRNDPDVGIITIINQWVAGGKVQQ